MHEKRNKLSTFERIIAPILGIAIAKITVKGLKQRTIVFKLGGIGRNLFPLFRTLQRNWP